MQTVEASSGPEPDQEKVFPLSLHSPAPSLSLYLARLSSGCSASRVACLDRLQRGVSPRNWVSQSPTPAVEPQSQLFESFRFGSVCLLSISISFSLCLSLSLISLNDVLCFSFFFLLGANEKCHRKSKIQEKKG